MTEQMFKAGGPLADAEEIRLSEEAAQRSRAQRQRQLDARKFIPRPFDTLETRDGTTTYTGKSRQAAFKRWGKPGTTSTTTEGEDR